MTLFKFIHTSDLHLGKRFGQFPEELRNRLLEARHGIIRTLADAAVGENAEAILVAGDVFDTETPTPAILRQALQAMGAAKAVRWVLMPGNHDSLAASELWRQMAANKPDNVILAILPEPIELRTGVTILPCPCTTRRPGRDLTEWASGGKNVPNTLRIGLAHGAIQSFSEDGNEGIIPPDRAERSGLDYLALGDWHGQMKITDRTWYSGTPERDGFKHDAPAQALIVTLKEPGALPKVEPVVTGQFEWRTESLDLLPGDSAADLMHSSLPEVPRRRNTLQRYLMTGRSRVADLAALHKVSEEIAPDFGFFELDEKNLSTEFDVTDIDAIDKSGALRQAAQALLSEAEDVLLPAERRETSKAALGLLYGYLVEDA